MDKFLLLGLYAVVIFAIGYSYGHKAGVIKTMNDFRKQMNGHKEFNCNNLKASKAIHVID